MMTFNELYVNAQEHGMKWLEAQKDNTEEHVYEAAVEQYQAVRQHKFFQEYTTFK